MAMLLLQLMFWGCLLLVAHTYVLFPLLLARLARGGSKTSRCTSWPMSCRPLIFCWPRTTRKR